MGGIGSAPSALICENLRPKILLESLGRNPVRQTSSERAGDEGQRSNVRRRPDTGLESRSRARPERVGGPCAACCPRRRGRPAWPPIRRPPSSGRLTSPTTASAPPACLSSPATACAGPTPRPSPQMLRSGLPRRLYLPLVAGPTGAGAGTAAESRPAVSPAVHGEFAVSLAPGGQTLAQKSSGCI